jgi:hypothetical protein
MSEMEVVRLLGNPSWVEPCGKSFGPLKPSCTEYIYRNSFAPLIPEYYSVSLDNSGRVLDNVHLFISLTECRPLWQRGLLGLRVISSFTPGLVRRSSGAGDE